jgi:hypothetical protein
MNLSWTRDSDFQSNSQNENTALTYAGDLTMTKNHDRRLLTSSVIRFFFVLFYGLLSSSVAAKAGEPVSHTEGELIAAVESHKTRDGAQVGEVIADSSRRIPSLRWWADRDKSEAGYSYIDTGQSRHFVIWEVGVDGTVTPLSEEAWVAELGRVPFAYFINQRNADAGNTQYVNRQLIGNPKALAFLGTADGNLAQIFNQRRLSLRRMTIEWVSDPQAKATAGRLYFGYLITVDMACRGPQGEVGVQRAQFIEPRGNGGFERLDRPEEKVISTTGTKCLP